ncbi:MAG: biotin/lipoyl-containing protein, partial [Ktedonobacteraceae bacterium]
MYEFKLADLGEGMHEAEIVQWLIKEGDTTRLDQTIAKVETDKAVVELPAPVAGRVSVIRVKDGQTAKVGDVLVIFETSTAANGNNAVKDAQASAAPASPVVQSSPSTKAPARPRPLAVPAVRKLAFELGVDLEQVTPSSPTGRISLEDVRAYAAEDASPASAQAQNTATGVEVAVPSVEEQPASQLSL